MNLSAILLGLINVLIIIAIIVLVFLIIEWVLGMLGIVFPPQIRKIALVIVALVALYLIAALLLGMPGIRIIGEEPFPGGRTIAAVAASRA